MDSVKSNGINGLWIIVQREIVKCITVSVAIGKGAKKPSSGRMMWKLDLRTSNKVYNLWSETTK